MWLAAASPTLADADVESCSSLAGAKNSLRFASIPDAPTTIRSARIAPAERDIPEICSVEGQIAPTIGFLLRMPTRGWNGKFMMGGCGGPCGNYMVDRIDPALVRNYAVVTSDHHDLGLGGSAHGEGGYHSGKPRMFVLLVDSLPM